MVFETTPSGCFVPTSHRTNQDGYFRKTWGLGDSRLIAEMFHRFIWRAHHGDIPAGHEIDHKCKTRACCNVKHLQCIPREEHLRETNETRYAPRKALAMEHWLSTRCTGTRLAELFEVSFIASCGWIREWKRT